MSKQPSFVGINEAEGTFTLAYLPSWFTDMCIDCPRYHRATFGNTDVGFCELIENEEPCEKTGIGPEGEK